MNFLFKMERKYGRYAIHNLMYYIVILYGVGMVLQMVNPLFYFQYLSLDMRAVLRGQVWRLITFIIYPPSSSLFFNLIALMLYYSIGNTLESVWGAFRFNVYFLMGIVGHILASLIGYLIFHQVFLLTTAYLNFSLFFAFAATFPEMQFLLFFVIPVKAKWLGLFNGIYFIYEFFMGNLAVKCAVVLSLANFLLFFLMTRNYSRINPKEIRRKKNYQKQVKIVPKGGSRHKCAVCGRTELDGDNLEFRYCSKCNGDYEYCQDHLYTHQHVE